MTITRTIFILLLTLLSGLATREAAAVGCNIPWGGINTIMAGIAECIKKEQDVKGGKGEQDGENEPAACKKDPESKECKTAKACKKSPVGSKCLCGKAPNSPECQAAKDCEDEPGSEACIAVGEIDKCYGDTTSAECNPDGPGAGGGPETEDGPGSGAGGSETGGTGGGTGAGDSTTVGDDDTQSGDADEDKDKDGEDKDTKEDLEAFVQQCVKTSDELTARARATPKDIAKSRVCKQVFDNALKCHRKLIHHSPAEEADEVMKAFNIRLGGEGALRITKSWICYCFYSLRHMDGLIANAKNDLPGYRFRLLKDRVKRTAECQRPVLHGIIDERLGAELGGGGGNVITNNPFADEPMTSATRSTGVLVAQCRSITDQLHDMIPRTGGGAVKEDLIHQLIGVATWCVKQGTTGEHDERIAPKPGRDMYRIGKYCKTRQSLPGCDDP